MKKTFNTLIKFILFSGISYAYGILNYTIMKKTFLLIFDGL